VLPVALALFLARRQKGGDRDRWIEDPGSERLVCALYAVPSDLEDAVVAHAVARAKASAATVD
jgi:hypothetical protein